MPDVRRRTSLSTHRVRPFLERSQNGSVPDAVEVTSIAARANRDSAGRPEWGEPRARQADTTRKWRPEEDCRSPGTGGSLSWSEERTEPEWDRHDFDQRRLPKMPASSSAVCPQLCLLRQANFDQKGSFPETPCVVYGAPTDFFLASAIFHAIVSSVIFCILFVAASAFRPAVPALQGFGSIPVSRGQHRRV